MQRQLLWWHSEDYTESNALHYKTSDGSTLHLQVLKIVVGAGILLGCLNKKLISLKEVCFFASILLEIGCS